MDFARGGCYNEQLRIDEDRFIPGMAELAEEIKRHGARAAVQLLHDGLACKVKVLGKQLLAPSVIAKPGYDQPREMTIGEITDTVECFAKSAARAQKAGFDGVEIQGAHRGAGTQGHYLGLGESLVPGQRLMYLFMVYYLWGSL